MAVVDPRGRKSVLLGLLLSTALAAAGCNQSAQAPAGNGVQPAAAQTGAAAPANPCGTFNETSAIPMNIGRTQTEVDCAAWQAFVALNWKADPGKPGFPDPTATWPSFGTPKDVSPTVWESYLEASTVFGNSVPLKGMWQRKRPAIKSLVRTSKFGDLDLSDIAQAGSGDHWLTNQRGDVTYYEIMMNQDEFEFITQNNFDLTTAAGQLACASQHGKLVFDGPPPPPPPPTGPLRGGMNFPAGFSNGWNDTDCVGNKHGYGQAVGAMEIKAAWTPLPADGSLDYRYKTAKAEIRDPMTKKTRLVTVGLVGLHIARKRFPKMPWVWATFEQIDNTPDEANGGFKPPVLPSNPNQKPSPDFTFFNPTCNPKNDPTYRCQHNRPPKPCGPSGTVCDPYNKPMQITRLNPVGNPANQVTSYVWSLLPAQSVFNYYRLIDVQWPQAPLGTPPGPGLRVPLTQGNPLPTGKAGGVTQIVANTTLESFQQNSNSCMDCHANFASIAPLRLKETIEPNGLRRVTKVKALQGQPPYASDYSFIFLAETRK